MRVLLCCGAILGEEALDTLISSNVFLWLDSLELKQESKGRPAGRAAFKLMMLFPVEEVYEQEFNLIKRIKKQEDGRSSKYEGKKDEPKVKDAARKRVSRAAKRVREECIDHLGYPSPLEFLDKEWDGFLAYGRRFLSLP